MDGIEGSKWPKLPLGARLVIGALFLVGFYCVSKAFGHLKLTPDPIALNLICTVLYAIGLLIGPSVYADCRSRYLLAQHLPEKAIEFVYVPLCLIGFASMIFLTGSDWFWFCTWSAVLGSLAIGGLSQSVGIWFVKRVNKLFEGDDTELTEFRLVENLPEQNRRAS